MLKKLPAFVMLAFSSCAIIYSQKTPEPSKQPAKPAIWNLQFEGGSYLGIETQEITKENFGKFGLAEVRGVAVEKVVENSPAAAAGIQSGDVIVKFEGENVESVRKLMRLLAEVAPDHQVKLTISRGGSEQEITATLGKREVPAIFGGNFKMENLPKMPEMPKTPQVPALPPNGRSSTFIYKIGDENGLFSGANRQVGIGVTPLTKQLGEYFGIEGGKGLLINDVRENSPAAKSGLKAGDIIIEADGKAIAGNADLIRAVNSKKEGDITLTIIRDRNRQTIQVTPEKSKNEFAPLFEENSPANFQMNPPPTQQFTPFTQTVPPVAPLPLKRIL